MKRYKYKILILTGAALALCIPIRFSSVHVEALKAPFVGILEYNFTYNVKEKPSNNSKTLSTIQFGQSLAFLGEVKDSDGDTWNYVEYYKNNRKLKGYVYNKKYSSGYRFGKYQYDAVFEKKISSFPESYKLRLRYMHSIYPLWNFIPVETGLDFNTAASQFQKSALISSNNSHLITSPKVLEGSSWRRASLDTVKYLMDPRNYLDAYNGIVFNKLSYNDSEVLQDAKSVLSGTVLSKYANTFYQASRKYDVSLFNSLTRAAVEQGKNGGLGYKGGKASGDKSGKKYYNIFNIGANGGAQDGINYAKKQGWNTVEKSIYGGMEYLGNKYIKGGQWSLYLQRFNVNKSSKYKIYTHSYMTNIHAPITEAKKLTYAYCVSRNHLDEKKKNLYIPVYKNMPYSTQYPDHQDKYLNYSPISLNTSASVKTGWSKINGSWYYYINGNKQTGWIKDKGTWYYLKSNGVMATDWIKYKGTWYYLKSNGAMATDWIKYKDTWYYLESNGAMATGWIKDKGAWYYLESSGAMSANKWIGKYHVNGSGKWDKTRK
ncbi:MAG: hypothetical protein ACTTIR_00250 [Eggerthia catenaformis]|uniref:N-acetylmuramoyl-L-alanine amidase family protein n=1 Tax=Eggerthia catenaformis TaxID=31973 RepID=UPI003F9FD7A5